MILRDCSEQRPWLFQNLRSGAADGYAPIVVETRLASLDAGDYTLHGHELELSVERKSGPDLYATLSHGRQRFEDELERLAAYPFSAVVVEAELSELIRNPPSKMTPRSFMGSIIALTMRHPTKWYFLPDRAHAETFCYRLLERWWKDKEAAAKPKRRKKATA